MWIVSCVFKTALKPVPGIWLCLHRRVLCRTPITWRLNSQRRGPWYWNLPASAPKQLNSRVCLCYTDFSVPFPQITACFLKGRVFDQLLAFKKLIESFQYLFFRDFFIFQTRLVGTILVIPSARLLCLWGNWGRVWGLVCSHPAGLWWKEK